jgi:hypothetical protein
MRQTALLLTLLGFVLLPATSEAAPDHLTPPNADLQNLFLGGFDPSDLPVLHGAWATHNPVWGLDEHDDGWNLLQSLVCSSNHGRNLCDRGWSSAHFSTLRILDWDGNHDWNGDGHSGRTTIPEPSAALVFAVGALAVAATVRRRAPQRAQRA